MCSCDQGRGAGDGREGELIEERGAGELEKGCGIWEGKSGVVCCPWREVMRDGDGGVVVAWGSLAGGGKNELKLTIRGNGRSRCGLTGGGSTFDVSEDKFGIGGCDLC